MSLGFKGLNGMGLCGLCVSGSGRFNMWKTFLRYAFDIESYIPLILKRWLCYKLPRGKIFTFLISARYFEAFCFILVNLTHWISGVEMWVTQWRCFLYICALVLIYLAFRFSFNAVTTKKVH